MKREQPDRSRPRAREDYLKAILQAGETGPVHAADVARRLRVSRASVSKLLRTLQQARLVRPTRGDDQGLRLTARGRREALAVVTRHRLVETFLHRTLGVPLHRVHAEAERIEHAVSADVARRLDAFLSHPSRDPHGHPISGARPRRFADVALSDAPIGSVGRVTRIADRDSEVVRTIARLGIVPDAVLRVVGRRGAAVAVDSGRGARTLSRAAATAVRVAVDEGRAR